MMSIDDEKVMKQPNPEEEEKKAEKEAKKVLEMKFQRDKQKCWEGIATILDQYNMTFDISTIIRNTGAIHSIDLIRRPPQQ